MINCSLCCFIAAALLGSMLYFILYQDNNTIHYFTSLLTKEQQLIYKEIIEERMCIYIQGFVLGLFIGILYLYNIKKHAYPPYCMFIALVLGVTYVHYTVMPKSKYMLNHITTNEQSRAWLKIYKSMKRRCHIGMVLGVLSLPFICRIFS